MGNRHLTSDFIGKKKKKILSLKISGNINLQGCREWSFQTKKWNSDFWRNAMRWISLFLVHFITYFIPSYLHVQIMHMFHVPCKSGKLVSVSTIILPLHWIQELFCRAVTGKHLKVWKSEILLACRDLGTPLLGTVCPQQEEFLTLLICMKAQSKRE